MSSMDSSVRDRVTAILALSEAATPGPWFFDGQNWRGMSWGSYAVRSETAQNARICITGHGNDPKKGDAEYIVAACNAFPDVAAALLEALDTIDKARELHVTDGYRERTGEQFSCCDHCGEPWPCPTWQALSGGNESGDDR